MKCVRNKKLVSKPKEIHRNDDEIPFDCRFQPTSHYHDQNRVWRVELCHVIRGTSISIIGIKKGNVIQLDWMDR